MVPEESTLSLVGRRGKAQKPEGLHTVTEAHPTLYTSTLTLCLQNPVDLPSRAATRLAELPERQERDSHSVSESLPSTTRGPGRQALCELLCQRWTATGTHFLPCTSPHIRTPESSDKSHFDDIRTRPSHAHIAEEKSWKPEWSRMINGGLDATRV